VLCTVKGVRTQGALRSRSGLGYAFLLPIKMMLPPGATMVLSAAGRDGVCRENMSKWHQLACNQAAGSCCCEGSCV
jgi:hypothetical protein